MLIQHNSLFQVSRFEAEQAEAENMYRKGMSMAAIARLYGCHYATISRICDSGMCQLGKMDRPAAGNGILDMHVSEIRQ